MGDNGGHTNGRTGAMLANRQNDMLQALLTRWFCWLGGTACFCVHGRARWEKDWRTIAVFASRRRDADSRWPRPFWAGTCITWTPAVIAVGWDFAEAVLREQVETPASRERPVQVAGGRIGDGACRAGAGAASSPCASEVLAHEIGHTGQARRLGAAYLPVVGALTLFREGPHWWNYFENQASADGQFGGLVNGSVCPELMARLARD
jgi:hypothetical protein